MSKSRRGRNRNKKGKKNPLLYGGIIGSVLLVAVIFFITRNQSPSGQVSITDGERPTWQTIPLSDARTGESFTLADFDDRNVFVKIMSPF